VPGVVAERGGRSVVAIHHVSTLALLLLLLLLPFSSRVVTHRPTLKRWSRVVVGFRKVVRPCSAEVLS